MTKSSFWRDGYRDAIEMKSPSLPGTVGIPDEEYIDGYCDALNIVQEIMWIGKDIVRQVAERGETNAEIGKIPDRGG